MVISVEVPRVIAGSVSKGMVLVKVSTTLVRLAETAVVNWNVNNGELVMVNPKIPVTNDPVTTVVISEASCVSINVERVLLKATSEIKIVVVIIGFVVIVNAVPVLVVKSSVILDVTR